MSTHLTYVQRIFRGYLSRLSTRMKMIENERKNRKLNEAATKINTMVSSHEFQKDKSLYLYTGAVCLVSCGVLHKTASSDLLLSYT